jgi:hypothetical protein
MKRSAKVRLAGEAVSYKAVSEKAVSGKIGGERGIRQVSAD